MHHSPLYVYIINQQDATLAVLCLLTTTIMLYMFGRPLRPSSGAPVAAVTVYIAPDNGSKGRPKHVEHTCSC